MDRRLPTALSALAVLLGAMITGLFLATEAPLRTALLWGLTSTALMLFALRAHEAPPDQDIGSPENP